VEEDSREIHGVELCLEGFSKICFGGSGRIIGENWTRVVGFPLTALDKIGVAMGVGCTFVDRIGSDSDRIGTPLIPGGGKNGL
jgi:hypothetical protein